MALTRHRRDEGRYRQEIVSIGAARAWPASRGSGRWSDMNFVNVLDMLDPITEPDPDAVVDWTDHFKEAIDLAVGGDFAGVLVPARDTPYRFRDPGANMNI